MSFEVANKAIQVLTDAGHDAYIVGGSIRDFMLVRNVHDWDIATSAHPVEIARVFERSIYENKFGTVGVCFEDTNLEITTFRAEHDYADFRRPHKIEWTSSIDIDLARRDFTINAMAWGVDHQVYDPFNGLDDLKARKIRAVGIPGERFSEDALRILRAARFAATLGFDIEQRTMEAMFVHADKVQYLSGERIQAELNKILLSNQPERGLSLLKSIGVLKLLNLEALNINKVGGVSKDLALRWAAMLKGSRFYSKDVERIVRDRLRYSNEFSNLLIRLLAYGQLFSTPEGEVGIRWYMSWAQRDLFPYLYELLPEDMVRRIKEQEHNPISIKELAINGNDIIAAGIKPGPTVGKILKDLLDNVLIDPSLNDRDFLLGLVALWGNSADPPDSKSGVRKNVSVQI